MPIEYGDVLKTLSKIKDIESRRKIRTQLENQIKRLYPTSGGAGIRGGGTVPYSEGFTKSSTGMSTLNLSLTDGTNKKYKGGSFAKQPESKTHYSGPMAPLGLKP